MPLLITGISHHTATLEIREKIAITRIDYADRVRELLDLDAIGVVNTRDRDLLAYFQRSSVVTDSGD